MNRYRLILKLGQERVINNIYCKEFIVEKHNMKRLLFNIFIVLSSSIVLIMLVFFTNGLDEMLSLLKSMNYTWIFASLICMGLYWSADASVIQTILAALLEKQAFANCLKVTMMGQFFNAITPYAAGGQPAQVYAMVKIGIRGGHAASALVIKSILYQTTLFIYTFTSFILKGSFFRPRVPHFSVLFTIGSFVNILVISFYGLFIFKRSAAQKLITWFFNAVEKTKLLRNADKYKEKLNIELERFNDGAAVLRRKPDMLIKVLTLQLIQFTFIFAVPYFIHLAVEPVSVNITDMIAAQSLVTMMSSLVPLPGSIGGAEGLSYLFFGIFFRENILIPVILIWRLITYYSNVILGGVFSISTSGKLLKTAH